MNQEQLRQFREELDQEDSRFSYQDIDKAQDDIPDRMPVFFGSAYFYGIKRAALLAIVLVPAFILWSELSKDSFKRAEDNLPFLMPVVLLLSILTCCLGATCYRSKKIGWGLKAEAQNEVDFSEVKVNFADENATL